MQKRGYCILPPGEVREVPNFNRKANFQKESLHVRGSWGWQLLFGQPQTNSSTNPWRTGHQWQLKTESDRCSTSGMPTSSRRAVFRRSHVWAERNLAKTKLGPPVVPLPFFGEGSPTKIDYRKKGSLILTSLLADLVLVFHWPMFDQGPERSCNVQLLLGVCSSLQSPTCKLVVALSSGDCWASRTDLVKRGTRPHEDMSCGSRISGWCIVMVLARYVVCHGWFCG